MSSGVMRFYMVEVNFESNLSGDRYDRTYSFSSRVEAKRFATATFKEDANPEDLESWFDVWLYRVDLPKMSNKKRVLAVAGNGWRKYSTKLQQWSDEVSDE